MTITLRYQSTGTIPGKGDPVTLHGISLTIGRGDENDLVLPDPDRLLSKRHCVVEDHNGNVVVVDISTNGTFLNYGKIALGSTPTPLNDGDILSLGPYELMVEISTDKSKDPLANIAVPLADAPISPGDAGAVSQAVDMLDSSSDKGDFLDELLGGSDLPAGPKGVKRDEPGDDGLLPPLDNPNNRQGASQSIHSPSPQDNFSVRHPHDSASVIPDDWDEDLPGDGVKAARNPFANPEPRRRPPGAGATVFVSEGEDFAGSDFDIEPSQPQKSLSTAPTPSPPASTPDEVSASAGQNDQAARVFLDALGVEGLKIEDQALTPTLARLGDVLRIMIHGLREILMTRTSIKSEFRIDQTQISARANNPLKFSISAEQAVQAMVSPTSKGYLGAVNATEQALSDIKAHEIAMVTGMDAALKGVLKKLDPAVLEEKITTSGGLGNVLKSKKSRYWEVYEKMFSEISDQAENDFHELFSKEFARAYKEQLERLR